MVFFDLPTTTKADVKVYNKFRKYLIKNGYIMLQYSVYCKIFPNREAVVNHVNILKRNVPQNGNIRIMMITEKQFSRMELIVGGKSMQEEIITDESLIIL